MTNACLIAILLGVLGLKQYVYCNNELRPLYVIGNMANTIDDVNAYLNAGANAIQADLSFSKSTSQPESFYRGFPCDCFRVCHRSNDVIDYFKYVRDISTPGHPNFISSFSGVLWIRSKLSGIPDLKIAGTAFATTLMRTVYVIETRLTIILELDDKAHWDFIDEVIAELTKFNRIDILGRIGVSANGADYFHEFMNRIRDPRYQWLGGFWLGDGVLSCFEHFFKTLDVREALNRRDMRDIGISKVARWTVDYKSNIRNAMWMDIDVIASNNVNEVRKVLAESQFSHRYRLATFTDDPFRRIVGPGAGKRQGCSTKGIISKTELCWMDTTLAGNWCWTNTKCGDDPSVCHHKLHCS
ncbi:dermonecrotic toxin LspiSicTox-betaIE1ii-like [Tubulanus polymorphus]|uniref:dermonecrotic toxin LspiSicTox-betaIE1ii-like n=1 Tax=Tubulanus polymorphus TaxID=672921 RepID=UPI003DA3B350